MGPMIDLGRYLEAIVDLTRHRDAHELAVAVRDTLRRVVAARAIRLLAITNENRDSEFNEVNLENAGVYDMLDAEASDARPLREDGMLLQCVRSQAPVIDSEGARRAVFPVFGANYVWSLVVIEAWPDTLP